MAPKKKTKQAAKKTDQQQDQRSENETTTATRTTHSSNSTQTGINNSPGSGNNSVHVQRSPSVNKQSVYAQPPQQQPKQKPAGRRAPMQARMSTGGRAPTKRLAVKKVKKTRGGQGTPKKRKPQPYQKIKMPKRSFKTHIYRVLKTVYVDIGISQNAMAVMNSFCNDIFQQLTTEAGSLCSKVKKKTMTVRDVEAATKLVLPGELCVHALHEGQKSVANFKRANKKP